jgi:hypothetical protein
MGGYSEIVAERKEMWGYVGSAPATNIGEANTHCSPPKNTKTNRGRER